MNTQLLDLLWEFTSSQAINTISKRSGVEPKIGSKIISEALPELLGHIQKNTSEAKWLENFLWALGKHEENISLSDIDENDGKKILGHILGNDETSITNNISQKLGIESTQASTALKNIAPILMKKFGKAKAEWIINSTNTNDILSALSKKNILTNILDKDGDGDIKDDLLNMGINYLKNRFLKK